MNVSKETFENEGSRAAEEDTLVWDRKGKDEWSVTEAKLNVKAEEESQSADCTTGPLTKALF